MRRALQVVAEAMNCTANIAKGLRKDYRGAAMTLCPGELGLDTTESAVLGWLCNAGNMSRVRSAPHSQSAGFESQV